MNDSPISVKTHGEKRRPVRLGNPEIAARQRDGIWYVDAVTPLGDVPRCMTDCLVRGANAHPERTLIARRGANGTWIRLSYADMLDRARCIGQALLDRGLSAERPLVILSGNDLQHAQLALGAMYAGIPYAPLSSAYSLLATDFGKLRDLIGQLTPGLVYATDGNAFGAAIDAVLPDDAELVLDRGDIAGKSATRFLRLLETPPSSVDQANAAIGSSTIAKFLFTSGSTKKPKAVITTQGMLCSNQQMARQTFAFCEDEPPVLVDWLPWNHTFGGSHNVGLVLFNGGTLYIDDGRPTGKDFPATLANLKEIAPTVYFNIPKGFEMLAEALEQDAQLRENFFSRVKLLFCAGAGLSETVWNRLDFISVAHCGVSIRIMTGLGMTETAPCCTFGTGDIVRPGYVGVPAPACKVKLVPAGDKMEARFHGPQVMPGYWRAPALTAEAFDEEGYYRTGDALRFVDPRHPELGFMFDGRIAEDFKLSTGTFVSVGPLRARAIVQGAPCVTDAVVTGLNRNAIGLLVFPRIDHCRALSGLPTAASPEQILASDPVRSFFKAFLDQLNRTASGSSTRVDRLVVLADPPSIDDNEITDKGSINQAAVLKRRSALIEAMYEGTERQTILAD